MPRPSALAAIDDQYARINRRDAAQHARYRITKQPGAAGHWLWQGKLKMTSGEGYAYFGHDRQTYLVPRLLYEDEYDLLPARLHRSCDEPRCVKPDHWL